MKRRRRVTVWVSGEPKTQGSHRIVRSRPGARPHVVDTGGRGLKQWRDAVATAVAAKVHARMEGPVYVAAIFYLRRPQHPKSALPVTRPDLDKLSRALLDALTQSGVFADDGQVVDLAVSKRWAMEEPGCYVSVREVEPDALDRR